VPPSAAKTKLARLRLARGLSQEAMAAVIGVAPVTYQRLERDEIENPPIGYLVNCAIVLGVEFAEVCEDRCLQWHRMSASAASPPALDWLPNADD
jgi:transcriptional regulator with XRE-family HTH domain